MSLTLIGLRGSGKTTVGRTVAERLGRRFVDADDEIERRAGRTIREVFATEGEAGFREIEREVMADLLGQQELVIAAGGGAVLSGATRSLLKQSGLVVYLQVSPKTAALRMADDATTATRRPALTDLDPVAEMVAVLEVRDPIYRDCANLVMTTDGLDVDDLATAIAAAVNEAHGQETGT